MLRCSSDLGYGIIECRNVVRGRLAEAAYLADELQGGGLDFL